MSVQKHKLTATPCLRVSTSYCSQEPLIFCENYFEATIVRMLCDDDNDDESNDDDENDHVENEGDDEDDDDDDDNDDDDGSCVNDHTRILETVVSQLKCDHWNESCLLLCTRRFCCNI